MSVLITGGAGFIGSHTARLLHRSGHELVLFDNLSTGRREQAAWGSFIEGDLADLALVRHILRERRVTAVIHLAASAHVGESIRRPDFYFDNNTGKTALLLQAMAAEGVQRLVFASSCSVYGNSASHAVHEGDPVTPVSPYGESKLATERTLPWYRQAFGLRWMALRYFNAAGAEDGLGEDVSQSLRIIPRAIYAALGEGPPLQVYGDDFPTPDGSAVRDFVHVADAARANLLALRYLDRLEDTSIPGQILNIGSGSGTSVLEIVDSVSRLSGRKVPFSILPARLGDPACAISDCSKARGLLGWTPVNSRIDQIVESVLRSCRLGTATHA